MSSKKISKIFHKEKNIIIGSLHFPPLPGFKDSPKLQDMLKMALADLEAFEKGGVDGIFVENNYGKSGEKINAQQAITMAYLCGEIRSKTSLPLGVSVLWNDFETAFSLAKTYNFQFIRVPVFVDTVKTYCGVIKGNPRKVKMAQKIFDAEKVAIFTDILVKHSKHITKHSLSTAAQKAIKNGSDAIIVTGNWTGEAPQPKEAETLRTKVGGFPIFIGSGVNLRNIKNFSSSINGVIVSTSLKKGSIQKEERNVKKFTQRIDSSKVAALVNSMR